MPKIWYTEPKILCAHHLLKEHLDHHLYAAWLNKSWDIDGFIRGDYVDPFTLAERHYVLEKEMLRRGMNHNSPIHIPDTMEASRRTIINKKMRKAELINDCPACRMLFLEWRDGKQDDLEANIRIKLQTNPKFARSYKKSRKK